MKPQQKTKAGDIIKVPFGEGRHTYGRILVEGSFAFYDCSTKSDRHDYIELITSDILFVAQVDIFALKEGYWTVVANIPLERNLSTYYPRYFNPAPHKIANINFYDIYRIEIEDAIEKDWIKTGRIQLDGIHGRVHIESRIKDYYEGRRNEFNRRSIAVFKKHIRHSGIKDDDSS